MVDSFLCIFVKSIQETAVAIAPFHTNDEGRLSFDVGQLIYLRRKGDKGWFQGEIRVCEKNFSFSKLLFSYKGF